MAADVGVCDYVCGCESDCFQCGRAKLFCVRETEEEEEKERKPVGATVPMTLLPPFPGCRRAVPAQGARGVTGQARVQQPERSDVK